MDRLVIALSLLVAPPATAAPLTVGEAVVCAGDTCGEHFDPGVEQLHARIVVHNPGPPTTLYVEWRHGERRIATRDVRLSSGNGHRVLVKRRLPVARAGAWTVDLYGGDRRRVHSIPFTIGEGGVAPSSDRDPAASAAADVGARTPTTAASRPCGALVALALGDGRYETAEVALETTDAPRTAPGLLLDDGRRAWAVRVVTRVAPGAPHRRWDQLQGVALDAAAAEPAPWHGYPVPDAPGKSPPRLVHRLEILQVFGHHLSMRATFAGTGAGGEPVAQARYVTLRGPGEVVDPLDLVSSDDRVACVEHVLARRRDPLAGGPAPDLRRSALRVRGDRVHLATVAGDPPDNVERPVRAPPELHPPDAHGWHAAPDGRGAVALREGRLVSRQRGALEGGPCAAILGVRWRPAGAPSRIDRLRRAFAPLDPLAPVARERRP